MLWITGSRGLLGQSLLKKCSHLPSIGTGREIDIANEDEVRRFLDAHPSIRTIVNCAAFCQVDEVEKDRARAERVNCEGPSILARLSKERKIQLLHISTDYVFSGKSSRPYREEDPTEPINFYGWSKREGERKVLSQGATVIRTSWLFGEGGKSFGSTLLSRLQKESFLRLASDQKSRFTYAPDLAEALLSFPWEPGIYHFANQQETTRYEFATFFESEARKKNWTLKIERIEPAPLSSFPALCLRPLYTVLDTHKLETALSHYKKAKELHFWDPIFKQIRSWQSTVQEFLCAN